MADQRRNTSEFRWISDLPDQFDEPEEAVRRDRSTQKKKQATTGRKRTSSGRTRSTNSQTSRSGRRNTSSSNRGRQTRGGARARGRRPRRRVPLIYKLIALVFLVVIIVLAVVFVRRFSEGSKAARFGMEAFNNGYYDQAVRDFTEAVSYDRGNEDYVNRLGMAQIQNADFDGALVTFNKLLDSAKSDVEYELAYRGIGMVQLYKNNYGDAVLALDKAASYAGKQYTDLEIDILYYLAEAQTKSGDPVGAVLSYTKIIEQREDAIAHMLRGVAYQEVGDHTNAEADLNKVIELNGDSFKANMTLYQVLMDEGRETEAEKLLKKAVEQPVKNAEDYSNRGFMYMYIGEDEKAMEDFNYAIDHDYFNAYFGKASLLMKQGNYEEAKENFDIYFVEFKDNAKAYNQYGICLMNLGLYDEAVAAFESGIAANDRSLTRELSFNIIVAYERTGQWKKAETTINDYIEKYPNDEVAQKELRFIKSRQHFTPADLYNHPELVESGETAETTSAPAEETTSEQISD